MVDIATEAWKNSDCDHGIKRIINMATYECVECGLQMNLLEALGEGRDD